MEGREGQGPGEVGRGLGPACTRSSSGLLLEVAFYGCSSLESLDLSGWDTSSVADMRRMFFGCESLESLDLSGWDTSSVAYMHSMFSGCMALESLDLSGWVMANGCETLSMFHKCRSLAELKLGAVTRLRDLPPSAVGDGAWYSPAANHVFSTGKTTAAVAWSIAKAKGAAAIKAKSSKPVAIAAGKSVLATKALKVTKNVSKGKITYKKVKGDKKIAVKNGKITVKKGLKKGTYTIKVKATSAATANYKAVTSKAVALKVKVK